VEGGEKELDRKKEQGSAGGENERLGGQLKGQNSYCKTPRTQRARMSTRRGSLSE